MTRGTLVPTGPKVAPGPVVSAELIDGGDDAGPITHRAQGEHASPWALPLGLLPFHIVERAACGAFISWTIASWMRIVGEELELQDYKRGGVAPPFPLSMT